MMDNGVYLGLVSPNYFATNLIQSYYCFPSQHPWSIHSLTSRANIEKCNREVPSDENRTHSADLRSPSFLDIALITSVIEALITKL